MIHTRHPVNECEVCAAQAEADEIGAVPTSGHMPADIPILDDDVAEIEAQANAYLERGWSSAEDQRDAATDIVGNIPPLCHTVKALRAESERLTRKYHDYERNYVLPCFTWAEATGFDLRKAVSANPGRNCVELLVSHLQSQLEQLTKERDALRDDVERLARAELEQLK